MPLILRLICYLLLVTGFVHAQEFNFEIEKGKVFTDDKSKTWVLFNADDGNGGAVILRLYFKGVNPKGYFLDSFDSQLNLKHRKEIVIDNNAIKNVFVKDGYVHLIEYRRNKNAKKDEFHLTSYSLEDFTSTSREILSIDKGTTKEPVYGKLGFKAAGYKKGVVSDPTGEVIVSENQKYFLFNLHQKEKRQKYQRVILFDDQFQVVYDHKFDGDIEDEYYRYFDITLNEEDGTAYFLGKKFNNNSYSSSIHGSVNYVYQVYRIDKIGRKKNNIRVIDRYIKSLNINLINDKLYCFVSGAKKGIFSI